MAFDRRELLALGAGAAALLAAGPAAALSEDEARGHVQATIDDLLALLKVKGVAASIAPKLRSIMERRANMPQLARFSAGRIWLEMSEDQRARYSEAFAHFVSVIYARRFKDVSGDPKIQIGRVLDAGRKGILVQTPLSPPSGEPLAVEWLVSDRSGKIEIVDILVEGISMAVTQREEIGALYQSQGQDVDQLIAKLEAEKAG